MIETIQQLAASGKTIVLSTHQMNLVESLCRRVFMIHQGKQVLYGDLERIRSEHSDNSVLVRSDADYQAVSLDYRDAYLMDGEPRFFWVMERELATCWPGSWKPGQTWSPLSGHERHWKTSLSDWPSRFLCRAKAGIQKLLKSLDTGLRRCDRKPTTRTIFQRRLVHKIRMIAKREFFVTVTRKAYIFAVIGLPLMFGGIFAISFPLQRNGGEIDQVGL